MKVSNTNYVYCLLLLLVSCTGAMSTEDVYKFISDEKNGLQKKTLSNGIDITTTYRPTDLWVHQELVDETSNKDKVESLRSKYNKSLYFVVSFSKGENEALQELGEGPTQFSEVMQTLSFRMPQYTTLTTSERDTIPVADFMLNRTYGLSTGTEVLFVFDAKVANQREWVQLNINEFGLHIGNQRVRFDMDDLRNAPKINFELK